MTGSENINLITLRNAAKEYNLSYDALVRDSKPGDNQKIKRQPGPPNTKSVWLIRSDVEEYAKLKTEILSKKRSDSPVSMELFLMFSEKMKSKVLQVIDESKRLSEENVQLRENLNQVQKKCDYLENFINTDFIGMSNMVTKVWDKVEKLEDQVKEIESQFIAD